MHIHTCTCMFVHVCSMYVCTYIRTYISTYVPAGLLLQWPFQSPTVVARSHAQAVPHRGTSLTIYPVQCREQQTQEHM